MGWLISVSAKNGLIVCSLIDARGIVALLILIDGTSWWTNVFFMDMCARLWSAWSLLSGGETIHAVFYQQIFVGNNILLGATLVQVLKIFKQRGHVVVVRLPMGHFSQMKLAFSLRRVSSCKHWDTSQPWKMCGGFSWIFCGCLIDCFGKAMFFGAHPLILDIVQTTTI